MYDLYLRATALILDFNKDANDKAMALLDQAIAIDRRFSSAYGALCNCMLDRAYQRWGDYAEGRTRGLQAARLAIEFGNDDAFALSMAALVLGEFGGDPQAGVIQAERAVALNPNGLLSVGPAGWINVDAGNPAKALEYFELAMRLSPLDPMRFRMYTGFGRAHLQLGHYEDALKWAEKALGEQPSFRPTVIAKISVLALLERSEESLAAIEHLRTLEPNESIGSIRALPNSLKDERREAVEAILREAGLPE